MNHNGNTNSEVSISYMELRKAIGILGIALPFVLIGGCAIMGFCEPWQSSISCYYHTIMRNVFEGIIWIFAIFLFFYRFEKIDNILTTLAAVCALGVALCPTHIADCVTCNTCNDLHCNSEIVGNFHDLFAISFFLVLAFMSCFVFTRTHKDKSIKPTPQKLKRNKVYRACGIIMFVSIVLIILYVMVFEKKFPSLENGRPIFILEAICLVAFGVSWIVKGEIVLGDRHRTEENKI